MEAHLSFVSMSLNVVMKRLTVLMALITVPSLIAAIYGMNFKYIPEIHVWGKYGYPFALSLMALSIVFMYFYFKKKEWL